MSQLMTEDLKKHLVRCESSMNTAREIISKHDFPDSLRNRTVIRFIAVLTQHQESVLLLVLHGNAGSASALVRPVVEGAFRALWINRPATDAEVGKFNKQDSIDLHFWQIAKALDDAYGGGGMFEDFKKRTWDPLNSFTHGGMHQLGRYSFTAATTDQYNEEDLKEITTVVTLIVLLAISLFIEKHGYMDSVHQIQSLLQSFDPGA